MFPLIAILFLLVPIIEIALLIQVGGLIGLGWTIFLVVLTAVIGVSLLKHQGLSTLNRAQLKLEHNELPAREILEGMGLVVAGALLLTPGFFTDAIGFILLFPPTRIWLVSAIASRMVTSASVSMHGHVHSNRPDDSNVIDGVKYHKDE
ncbi:MAG: FxsA family protein [Gammaproteobacteria bacterium]|nr:FxsA family protein [Gammaproteobacteria bacterium]